MEPPDQAPALTPTVRTPQCGHAVWGISLFKLFSGTTYWVGFHLFADFMVMLSSIH